MSRLLFLSLLIAGCQQATPPTESGPRVRLRFPQGLKSPSARWERFLGRVIQLEINVGEGTGAARRLVAGPLSWNELSLPEWRPPPGGEMEIDAKVWDRNAEGVPRPFAIATGKAKLTAAQWEAGEEIPLRLTLQVSVKEYD